MKASVGWLVVACAVLLSGPATVATGAARSRRDLLLRRPGPSRATQVIRSGFPGQSTAT